MTATLTLAEDSSDTITLNAMDIDSTTLTYQIITVPTNGTVSFNGTTNTVTYTPDVDYVGSDSFSFTVTDDDGLSSQAIIDIIITPVNDAPTAMAGTLTLAEDSSATIALNAMDIDSTTLTYQIITVPTNGTVTIAVNGNIATYTPNVDYAGIDSFSFSVTDGDGLSSQAIIDITITPVNDAPTAMAGTLTLAEDSSATIALNAMDIDSTTLTYQIITVPTNGTVTIAVNGNIATYTPNVDYAGIDSFSFSVTDGDGLSSQAIIDITITPVNDAPTAMAGTLTLAEDSSATIALNAMDIDSTTLTYQIITVPTNGTVTIAVNGNIATYTPNVDYAGSDSFSFSVTDGDGLSSQPAIVSIIINSVNDVPVVMAIDDVTLAEDSNIYIILMASDDDTDANDLTYQIIQPNNGGVTLTGNVAIYTPNDDYNGFDSFTFTVTDDVNPPATSKPVTVNIEILPVSDAPVVTGPGTETITLDEDTSKTITLSGRDDDGETFTFQITTVPNNGTITFSANNMFIYTPEANYNGNDSFIFRLIDSSGVSSQPRTINIAVSSVNDVPVADSIDVITVANITATIMLSGSDVDGDTLSYAIATGASNGSVTLTGKVATYIPNEDYIGSDSFTFTVTDGTATPQLATVNVTIAAVNESIVALTPTTTTLNEDSTATITLSGGNTALVVIADLDFKIAMQPSKGDVTLIGNVATYTPEQDYYGSDSFTFIVSNSEGISAPAIVNIEVSPINDIPTAMATSANLNEDETATITLSGSDVDDDDASLNYQIVTGTTNGTVTLTIDGTATYTPDTDYFGSDSFALL